jgi:hypothetical protein
MISKLLTTTVLVIALISLFGETTSDAQNVRVNDRIVTPSGLPAGIVKDGAVWKFLTGANGSQAPMIIGFLSPPQREPTNPEESGSLWTFCSTTADLRRCALKINDLGEEIELVSWER